MQTIESKQPKGADLDTARKLFGMKEQVDSISRLKEEMKQNRLSVIGDEDVVNRLEDRIGGLSPQEIKELSDDAIREIFSFDDGEIEFAMDFANNKKREIEFKRDYLVYVRESEIANVQIDVQLEQLQKDMAEHDEEFKQLIAQYGDLSAVMRQNLQDEWETAEGDRKEKLSIMIEAYDDAFTLNRIYDHYEKYGTRNTISDYHARSEQVYKKYMKVISKLDVKTDLTNFNNLEVLHFPEKYHKIPNIFLFAVIKQYAYKKGTIDRSDDGVFLSQLAVNIRSLYTGSMNEEKAAQFKENIQRVLNLFL